MTRDPFQRRADYRRGEADRYETRSYAGWVTFLWRSASIEFPDFPGFRAHARCGPGFEGKIREQLTQHVLSLRKCGQPIPAPTWPLPPDGGRRLCTIAIQIPAARAR
ncbi:MAG TPA: hypothetical protein VFW98_15940 [Gemmatimonadaceae bacterium]|nr:hypothetical protein [Gemmatimonadaceae bacterium]